jgi:hypothetical protein
MHAMKELPKSRAARAEALGLVLIALAVLVAILARWRI